MKNKVYHIILSLCWTFFVTVPSNGQVAEINTWLDSTLISIGEQVKLHIEVKKELQANVKISELKDSLPAKLEMIGNVHTDTSKLNNKEIISQTYIVTSFDSGKFVIPAIPVYYTYHDLTDTLHSNSLYLQVYIPDIDTTQAIKDIKPLINTPLSFGELLPYLGIGFGTLILVAIFIYLYLRFRKKKPVFLSTKKELPPHIIAFNALDKLKDEKLWQDGKVKEYYVRLSDILRIYLENRYKFRSMECVTDEILGDFYKVNKEDDVKEMLKEILQTSDMVKFAKHDPLPTENQSNLNNAYFFVEKTKLEEIKTRDELLKENASLHNSGQKMIV